MTEAETGLDLTIEFEREPREALIATFTNRGDRIERLLAHFEPARVFFTVSAVRDDGTPVHAAGGGKVALNEPPAYVALRPGESHTVRVDLAKHGSSLEALPPGSYTVGLEYHNQYGEGCLRGVLPSRNRLSFEV
jgi:hypothetical protein